MCWVSARAIQSPTSMPQRPKLCITQRVKTKRTKRTLPAAWYMAWSMAWGLARGLLTNRPSLCVLKIWCMHCICSRRKRPQVGSNRLRTSLRARLKPFAVRRLQGPPPQNSARSSRLKNARATAPRPQPVRAPPVNSSVDLYSRPVASGVEYCITDIVECMVLWAPALALPPPGA